MYYFSRQHFAYGLPWFVKDKHPMALYVGNRRLSPGPSIVFWFPLNWLWIVVCLLLSPWKFYSMWKARKARSSADK